jgi:DNA-directed RNA polymerase subunit beta
MVEKGQRITKEHGKKIQNSGINSVEIQIEDRVVKVLGNNFVSTRSPNSFPLIYRKLTSLS